MNWDAIGALGELIGAAAVVLTLGYFAIQVKSAKQTAVDSITLQRTKIICDGMMSLAVNDDVRRSFDKISGATALFEQMAPELDMNPDEASRAHYSTTYWFWLHWGQFTSAKSDRDLNELGQLIASYYQIQGVRYMWDRSPWVKPLVDEAFIEFVERQLR